MNQERLAPSEALALRPNIEQIVIERNEAIAKLGQAWEAVDSARIAIARAGQAVRRAAPNADALSRPDVGYRDPAKELLGAHSVERSRFDHQARLNVDAGVWRRIVEMTQIERLMDRTARDELEASLRSDPPTITVENVTATIEGLIADAETIFRRGIAVCFSKLDRRFRSHLGFRMGRRIIVDGVFDIVWGTWGPGSHTENQRATLIDVERTFHVLDGKRQPDIYAGIVGKLDAERRFATPQGPRASEIETEYFTVRTFKNGNCHVWFRKKYLLDAVNGLLADYYGEVLPDASQGRTESAQAQAGGKTTAMAKSNNLYVTPGPIVERMIQAARMGGGEHPLRTLEPSAGTGVLAKALRESGAEVDCVEIDPGLVRGLREQQTCKRVIEGDFLSFDSGTLGKYDRIVMNPPFEGGLDISHVNHAIGMLNQNGILVAVMAAATEFRETRQAREFRHRIEELKGRWVDLEPGAFRESGTEVNTMLLTVQKGASQYEKPHGSLRGDASRRAVTNV